MAARWLEVNFEVELYLSLATATPSPMNKSDRTSNRWNALSLPIVAQTDALIVQFAELQWLAALDTNQRLQALSKLLKSPQYTLSVARLFSPLLVDLCARWLDDEEEDERKFAVMGLLLPAHEELYPYVNLNFHLLVSHRASASLPGSFSGLLWQMGHLHL